MGTDNTTSPQGGQGAVVPASESMTEERVIELVKTTLSESLNPAITGHLKRFSSQMEKTVADIVGKAVAAVAPKPEESPTEGTPPKVDPEVAKLREKLDKLERSSAEAEARAKAVEDRARKDSMRAFVKEALEAKGIKGARARAVIADLEQSGTLRFDEEGAPLVVVKRSRGKGAPAQEVEYRDLGEGIDDWAKTQDAQEFLPPPPPPKSTQRHSVMTPGTITGRPGDSSQRPASEAEAVAATLAQLGNDSDAVFAALGR